MEPHENDTLGVFAPALLALGAMTLIAAAIAQDLGFGGGPGFGRRETGMTVLGLVVGATGAFLASATRRQKLTDWLARRFASTPVIGRGEILGLAAWLGLLSGFVELIQYGIQKFLLGYILKQSEHELWITPITYLLLFLAVAVILGWLLARLWPRGIPISVAVAPLAMLAAWCPFSTQRQLAGWTVVLVCAGIALQIARSAANRPAGYVRLARKMTPWMLGLVVLAAAGIPATKAASEMVITARLPDARPGAPNVLLIVLDTVRADHLGAYGYSVPTSPNLDAFAEQAVTFERCFSGSPWTLPAHATMFTGRYQHESGVEWLRALTDKYPTLAEVFTGSGYATAGFVGNVVYCLRENGIARGFTHYEDILVRPGTIAIGSSVGRLIASAALGPLMIELSRNNATTVTDSFLGWLDGGDERPFFAFLNYFDAHAPYLPPDEFMARFGPREPHVVNRFGRTEWSAAELQGFVNAYDADLLYIDHELQRIFDRLRTDGVLDDTIVIVTSDHGAQFGEHGLMDHGNSLYRPLLHVPLMVRFPARVPVGSRVKEFVSLRDLAATVLDLSGANRPAEILGNSLAPLWDSGGEAATFSPLLSEVTAGIRTPSHEPVSRGDMVSLVQDGWHLIINGDNVMELYDIRVDPREDNDRGEDAEQAPRVERMRAAIRRLTGR